MTRTRAVLLTSAVLGAAACAPVTMGGPGVQVGLAGGGILEVQSASCAPAARQLAGSPFSLSRSASFFALQRHVQRLQARFQLGSQQMRAQPESWKRLASGDC